VPAIPNKDKENWSPIKLNSKCSFVSSQLFCSECKQKLPISTINSKFYTTDLDY